MAINHLLSIGNHALIANQVAISVTGNNMANVNTVGYSKQTAEFNAFMPYDAAVGQMGMGAEVSEITRAFDQILENTYLSHFTSQGRYTTQSELLASVEAVFNESNREGVSSMMTEFFNSWQDLAKLPNDLATQQALLSNSDALAGVIRDTQATLEAYQNQIDDYIAQDVQKANEIINAIADLNVSIAESTSPGNNPNYLLDQRDQLVRELSEIVDVTVQDKGGLNYTVLLSSGQPLVEGDTTYSLEIHNTEIDYNTQGFTGEVNVDGQDSFEYTLELTSAESFRVSLDGGKTWLKNPDGSIQSFDVPEVGEVVRVKDLELSFTADDFATGDKITIVPKSGLYWNSPTRPPENVTPLLSGDGTEEGSRISGGSLTAFFTTRDYNIGKYMDKMDALATTLAWEVNRAHSQGASVFPQSTYYGEETVENSELALGDSASGLFYADRLQEGSFSMYFYNDATGELTGSGALVFDPSPDGTGNFDPSVHTLNDVIDAINTTFTGKVKAEIVSDKLQITATDGTHLSFGEDSTGLLAALGVNTFFTGSDAGSLAVKDELQENPALINSGKVNQAGVITAGDNTVALQIAKLATTTVSINTAWEQTSQTLTSYYSGVVSLVGAESSNAQFNTQYHTALASDAGSRIASIKGVNLDEEMTNLIKFQHSYTAAAKLITTADEMLQVVLGLKA